MPNNSDTKTLTFRGLDGYAGFIHGMKYELAVTHNDDGTVSVPMPHAPQHGAATFSAKQWEEWWLGKIR